MSEEKNKEDEQEQISEKIDEKQLVLEYLNKDKEKLKPNKNDFNRVSYIEYVDLFKKIKPEFDFLYDYSKILGPENNDPKTIQWQLANLDRLFKYGIDISVLKKRNKEQSSGHFKMSNVLENISYRLQKHGRLAPSIDIARDLPKRSEEEQFQINEEEEDEEDINIENEDINNGDSPSDNFKKPEDNNNIAQSNFNSNLNNKENNKSLINTDKNFIDDNNPINSKEIIMNINLNKDKKTNNPNGYNGYEDNFYDKNDPFIDDELDNTSEENEFLYKLSLEPGNYSEQEILNNLKKNLRKTRNSVKKKKKIKNIKGKKEKDKDKEKGKKSVKKLKLSNKLLNNKTKRKNNEDNKETSKKKKKITLDFVDNLDIAKINFIFGQMLSDYDSEINTDHEKESFMRRNIKVIEDMYKKNNKDFISVLSEKFQIPIDKTKIFVEYELFKSVLENKYSNFSKFLNKLYTLLKENGVLEINALSELKKYMISVPEIEKSLNHVMDNILCYRDKFNSYMGKHYYDMSKINENLECFIPNIRERNNEYITKMSSKINEYEDKFKIIIPKEFIVNYIKEKNPNIDFSEDLNNDLNNRRFSLESFIFYDIGLKVPVYLQNNEKEKDKENIIENNEKENEKEKGKENFIVALDNNNEMMNVKKNDIFYNNKNHFEEKLSNENQNNNINNKINDNKIFQSTKTLECKAQKIFVSKIEFKDNNMNQGIQTDNHH